MSKVIGIDLGTTNSCVALVEGSEPIIIPNAIGQHITPSVVRFLENGGIIVGEHANRSRLVDPHNTITGIKRLIGRRYNEIVDIAQSVPFNISIGKNNLAVVKIRGTDHSPQVISAMILSALKSSAENYLGMEVTQTVITVPAYFNDRQRQATRDAAKIAGLDVLRMINEPTAAALAYGLTRKSDATIAVFDLGGGTFDISIMEVGEGVAEVKAIDGDGYLGGDDFDNFLVTWMIEEFRLLHGIDISEDSQAMQRIREETIRAKCIISQIPEVVVNIPFLANKRGIPINLEMVLTRRKFEQICEELFERLIKPCERVLKNTGLKGDQIDKVILVGGATRMPKISEIVRRVFDIEPSRAVNPEEAVALGAAIQGGVLSGNIRDFLLMDVYPYSLGVEIENGLYCKLIEKNTTIPTRKSEVFSTSLDNQSSAEIHILEGDGKLVIENRTLGRFTLENIPPAPRTLPQIEITFDIDTNGILNVEARDLGTGISNKITILVSTGLTKEDLYGTRLPPIRIN